MMTDYCTYVVLLCTGVNETATHLFEDRREDVCLVLRAVHPLQLRQADEVRADQQPEVFSLSFSPFFVFRRTLLLSSKKKKTDASRQDGTQEQNSSAS